jgi:trans-aconitate methyltransferase
VKSPNPNFEFEWLDVFRHWLFARYLSDSDSIYEFGCGTGYNLALLGSLFPRKKFYGLDWSASSNRIVNRLGRMHDWKMRGMRFDFFAPDTSLSMEENSAVLTIDALEQIGTRYEKFLKFVTRHKPAICVNIEPIVEWYDSSNLFDYLAILHHRKRRYLEGLVTYLEELEAAGEV